MGADGRMRRGVDSLLSESILIPFLLDAIGFIHPGKVAKDFNPVAIGVAKVHGPVLSPCAVALRMRGAVHQGAAHDFDAAFLEPLSPGEELDPVFYPKCEMMQPQVLDGP